MRKLVCDTCGHAKKPDDEPYREFILQAYGEERVIHLCGYCAAVSASPLTADIIGDLLLQGLKNRVNSDTGDE